MTNAPVTAAAPKAPSLIGLLGPYRKAIGLLILLVVLGNGLNLLLPQLIARGIDAYGAGTLAIGPLALEFSLLAILIFVFTYLQNVVQTITSEKAARDLRTEASAKISRSSYAAVQQATPAKLLTNLTSDVDAVKMFISQAVVSIVSSLFLILGASVLLVLTNWKLALATLMVLPIIGGTFFFVFGKVRLLFKKGQEVVDWLNKVINESILGSALIRVLNSQLPEQQKFIAANTDAKNLGLQILRLFASMIPVVMFVSNLGALIILVLGGRFVINGSMTLGELAAFNAYLTILIFPIFVLGFMSTVIARASASYARILEVLNAPEEPVEGGDISVLRGELSLKNVTLKYGEKIALKDVSFTVPAGTRTAVIGPTGAGKTQLLHLLSGLIRPQSGTVEYDGKSIDTYQKASLHRQIGLVFQDSVLFNMSVRQNIAFGDSVKEEDLQKAVKAAELDDFVSSLPEGLNTIVSERGTSLSGGQKQRIMLARALALNPRVLLLDDFTARVDARTEEKILKNVHDMYPGITVLSVTQKISSAEKFDQIVLLMEGELLGTGTHEALLSTSTEYAQIDQSQRSTSHYEVHAR